MTGHQSASPVEDFTRRAPWLRLVMGAFVLVGLVPLNPDPVAAVAAAAVACGALVVLFRPGQPPLPAAVLATGAVAVLGHGMSSNVGWFAVCLLGGWCTLTGLRRDGAAYWAGALVLFGVEWLWIHPDPGWAAWMAGTTLTCLAGLVLRRQLDLVAQLREAQAGLADRTRVEERNRIARELHDVIAHTLTVSQLHVTSARLAVEHDPQEAARSLAEAERLGRESLAEVRAAVGMLHGDGAAGDRTAPLPGLAALPALVERFRSARADVDLAMDGDPAAIPATTGLAVYRIAQEALTNAVKHAPGRPVAVVLTVEPSAVSLTVDSAGRPTRGSGLGLISMRERAESSGGTCVAGPGGRGWLVRASLPLAPGSA